MNTPKGDSRRDTKISDADVVAIRASTDVAALLATKYGVTRNHIYRIKGGYKRVQS
jgi:hypothetical protein